MKYSIAFAACVALLAQPAPAEDRIELAPSSNWVINYDAESCALQRDFGEDGQKVFLELRSFDPLQVLSWQVIVASKDLTLSRRPIAYSIEPITGMVKDVANYRLDMAEGYKGRMFQARLPVKADWLQEEFNRFVAESPQFSRDERDLVAKGTELDWSERSSTEFLQRKDFQDAFSKARSIFERSEAFRDAAVQREKATEGIFLDQVFSDSVFLKTGDLSKPLAAMETCLDELAGHWGIDAEANKTLLSRARPEDYETFAKQVRARYPIKLVRTGVGDTVLLRLDISAEGKLTGCHLQLGFSDDDFQETACKAISDSKFVPALDVNGQPIASYYRQSITYRAGN